MRILLDECIPRPLRQYLPDHFVSTAQEAGFGGFSNGELLHAIEDQFDIFITADKNLRYQQNLQNRRISILMLSTNRWPLLQTASPKIIEALQKLEHGDYLELTVA